MPDVYLSPSTQGYNPYIIGESEKYYMNLKRDKLRQERPERQRRGGCRTRKQRKLSALSRPALKRRARHI